MSDPQQPPYAPQPDQPSTPYGQTAYGQPAQPSGYPLGTGFSTPGYGSAPAETSTLGRTAFIIAVIAAAIGLLFVLANPFLIPSMRDGYAIYQIVSFGRSILGLALGALALILGIIAARRGAQPVLAGIAIGVGGVEVLGVVTSFLVTLIYTVI
ncbi:hypothetical protein QF046_002495 [Microbacterium sp. W4I4]|uniref:hypothetical protein n=1 Tax=Microbacterium sp. W4I4 TaxID=3042295 RepID=UPI002782E473|nr:hypothetical protein [Microbacterium sp. W4I4]MDQ0614854.1 hypothetical protein [Microbacterium sp. W4I4]